MYIVLSDREFDPRANYQKPIEDRVETEQWHNNLWYNIDNFDHHGFDLCRLERLYAKKNMFAVSGFRARHWVLQKDWFLEDEDDNLDLLSDEGSDDGNRIILN